MRNTLLFSLALGMAVTSVEAKVSKVSNPANLTAATAYSVNRLVQNTVTGTVSDANGPIAGVTVSVVGVPGSVKTDANGKFKITAALGATLRFSSVGYTSQDVKVSGNTVNITLSEEDNALEEVVVVGYGTQKKGNLTGAVASISVKDNLEGRPIADVGRGIQGTTPGLTVTIPSGQIGADPKIKIRGAIASVQGNGNPLILMDNVEIPSIQYVNPDDIESITILKDAASSSIYGAKAAFGVILITTKTGSKTERVDISYSNNFSFQNPYKKYEMGGLNSLKYIKDAFEREGKDIAGAFYYVTADSYKKAVEWEEKWGGIIGPNDPTVYGRDWIVDPTNTGRKLGLRTYDPYDYMVREWAPTITHNASINGNTGKTRFTGTFGHISQSGMLKPGNSDKFKRANAAVRVSTDISDYLTVRAGLMFSQRNKTYPYATNSVTADPWYYMYRWSTIYPMGDDEFGNPIRSAFSEYDAANEASMKRNYINASAGATLKINSNWKVDVDYNFTNEDFAWYRPGTRFTAADSWSAPVKRLDENGKQVYVDNTGAIVAAGSAGAMEAYRLDNRMYTALGSNPDHISMRNVNENKHTLNAFTTYNWDLEGGHELKFIGGVNLVSDNGRYSSLTRTQILDITNPQIDLATGQNPTVEGGTTWAGQLGYFGRVNYAFKNKYLLEANLRYDGSSKFLDDLRWRWFPSVSAGWVVSEEQFMDWSKPVLSHLKVRGSYGVIGNQSVPASLYRSLMASGESSWVAGGSKLMYIGSPKLSTTGVTWEDLETKDLGIDARFFNSKLGLVFDYYVRTTKNMFAPMEGTTWTLGGEAALGNYGQLKTKGYEIAIDFNHKFDNGLGINVRANMDDAISRFYNYTSSRLVTANYDGKAYGEIWGYVTDRLYQNDDFVLDGNGKPVTFTPTVTDSKHYLSGNNKAYRLKGDDPIYQMYLQNSATFLFGPGDVKFKDLNGDGEIDNGDGTVDNPGDRKIIGNSTPRYNYGLRLGADYKGFDFSMFFQGVGERALWGDGALAIAGYNIGDGAMPAAIVNNYWTPDNTNAFYPAAFNNANSNLNNNMQTQTRYLLDMSYLRIKNITLGYSVPSKVLDRAKINNLRVYVALENFFTWDKLNGLPIDPETEEGTAGESIFTAGSTTRYNGGRTGVGTPTFKSASFGVQLSF